MEGSAEAPASGTVLNVLGAVEDVSLPGTGPSHVAADEWRRPTELQDTWETKPGTTFRTTTQHDGARTR